jgi:hypothetical protein
MPYTTTIETAYPVDIPPVGSRVVVLLDPEATPLVVVRIEPMLACVKPDGAEVIVPAHAVEVLED